MFNWEGCPFGLFDLYMEVGEVKIAESTDTRVCIEVWIGSGFAKEHSRPECIQIRRRPIYGVLKQLRKLSAGREASLLFMCDDADGLGNDTENQSCSIFLLLRELKKLEKLGPVVLYTRKTREQIRQRSESIANRRDKMEYDGLYEILDVLVTGQANRYSSPASGVMEVNNQQSLTELRRLVNI